MIGTDGGTRTHMVSRTILSRVRLPIPPHRHILIVQLLFWDYNPLVNHFLDHDTEYPPGAASCLPLPDHTPPTASCNNKPNHVYPMRSATSFLTSS